MTKYNYTIRYDDGITLHLDGLTDKLDLEKISRLDFCLLVLKDKRKSFLINTNHVVCIEETCKEEE